MIILVACGTTDNKEKEVVGGSQDTSYEKHTDELPVEKPDDAIIEEGSIAVELVAKENADMQYLFKLLNTTDQDLTLTYGSLQEYDFIIKDQAGEKIYQFSEEMVFAEAFVEKVIPANDALVMEVDVTNIISTLEGGIYSLEIWSSARESDGL